MFEISLHVGTEHPNLTLTVVASILSLLCGLGVWACSDRLREYRGHVRRRGRRIGGHTDATTVCTHGAGAEIGRCSIVGDLIPGETLIRDESIEINAGRETASVTVENTGDRPSQVGSHFHFFGCNPALDFDRETAYGMRLDIPAGTAIRFEPGCEKDVELVAIGDERIVHGMGMAGLCGCSRSPPRRARSA
jgi:urease subunit beta